MKGQSPVTLMDLKAPDIAMEVSEMVGARVGESSEGDDNSELQTSYVVL